MSPTKSGSSTHLHTGQQHPDTLQRQQKKDAASETR
jgi:hypothetical protein